MCILAALLSFGASALAQTTPPPMAPVAPPMAPVAPPMAPAPPAAQVRATRSTSITVSPVHLLGLTQRTSGGVAISILVLETTAEFRAHPRVGVAAIGGIGRISVDDGAAESNLMVYELGAQVNGYVTGGFDKRNSFLVGAEALYTAVSGTIASSGVTGFAEGVSVGPFIGYKFIANGGFTFLVQFGMAYIAIRAESEGTTDEASKTSALLNLNLGWSF